MKKIWLVYVITFFVLGLIAAFICLNKTDSKVLESLYSQQGRKSLNSTEYKHTQVFREELITDLNIDTTRQNIYILNLSEDGMFTTFNLSPVGPEDGGGYYVIAKKIDGKWRQVAMGQDTQLCDTVKKYEIPNEISPTCYDLNLQSEVENK
jgi:hypothetical protein